MPLALELAACVRVLAPTDILTRLDDRFRLLRTASKHADERHRTLHNTVAWSYDLLLEPEQRLFDRLSAFAGSFSPEAVEAVCSDDAIDRDIVIDLLDRLVAKSMIVATRTSRGVRYHLLALRAFATEKLRQRGETAQLRDRHLHHVLTIGASSAAMIVTAKQLEASERFDESWDDLRDAHRWCLDTNDLTSAKALVGSVQIFAILRGRFEFLEWAQRTIDACVERLDRGPGRLRCPSDARDDVRRQLRCDHRCRDGHRRCRQPRLSGNGPLLDRTRSRAHNHGTTRRRPARAVRGATGRHRIEPPVGPRLDPGHGRSPQRQPGPATAS